MWSDEGISSAKTQTAMTSLPVVHKLQFDWDKIVHTYINCDQDMDR